MQETEEIPVQTLIKRVLKEKGAQTPKQIASVLGKKTTYGTVRQELSAMARTGDVEKPHRGVYSLPDVNSNSEDRAGERVANGSTQSDLFKEPPVFGDNKLPRGTIQVFMQDGVVVGYIALSSEFVWLKPKSVEADALIKAVEVDATGEAEFES